MTLPKLWSLSRAMNCTKDGWRQSLCWLEWELLRRENRVGLKWEAFALISLRCIFPGLLQIKI
jgi:hypothetical protein